MTAAKVVSDWVNAYGSTDDLSEKAIASLIERVRAHAAAEREACATVAITFPAASYDQTDRLYRAGWEDAVTGIAAAIRALGEA